MRLLATLLMITMLGITDAQPVKRSPDKDNPNCLTWVGTAPSCNGHASSCPHGYTAIYSDQDALHTENVCLTGSKYLCRNDSVHFLDQNSNF